ncbi:MAG: AMP phosphorylase [Candidatus Aenigmarchaeota archaeon]|nr:AMP phosphorylase [Candidatus Aenigmarchaeota archaeon]
MQLKSKLTGIESGSVLVVMLNYLDAAEMGIHSTDRVKVSFNNREAICVVDISKTWVGKGSIGLYKEVEEALSIKTGDPANVSPAEAPRSLEFITKKMNGARLNKQEMFTIVKDTVDRKLSDIELTAFVSSLHFNGLSMDETVALSASMAETGKTLGIKGKMILDKHSLGGVPGDKTTMLVVPIIAAAGYKIPKTSSRAITSPAGTADRVECLCPVTLSVDEILRTVEKTNGCLAWGGAVDLAPADDMFIQVEYPLSIDPLLLPSVMSKKKAAGSTHVVIDMPTGRGSKLKTIGEAQSLAKNFIELGKNMGIIVNCVLTFGEQPIGYGVGPALEAREALSTISNISSSPDLVEKAVSVAGVLLEMAGEKNGKDLAYKLLKSGSAERKLRQIIGEQGGDSKIKPSDIEVGSHVAEIKSKTSGTIWWIANHDIVKISREAGTPKDRGAGVLFRKKIGDTVKNGEVIMEVYAEDDRKLHNAIRLAESLNPVGVYAKMKDRMFIEKVPDGENHKKFFVLER